MFGIEQVAAGLTEVAETIGISLHPIESLNRSTGSGDGRDVLDPSLQREVRRAYEADAELHQRSQNGVVWLR